jgi:hypothetical protein
MLRSLVVALGVGNPPGLRRFAPVAVRFRTGAAFLRDYIFVSWFPCPSRRLHNASRARLWARIEESNRMSPTFSPTAQRAVRARLLGRLRLALTLALMLALPLQTIAGVLMPFCGAAHHGNAAPASESDAAQHDHAQATADHHQHGSKAAMDDGRCSACLTCCGAAALVGGVVALSPAPSVVPALSRFYRFDGFIADTPERPPRSSLA